MMAGGPRSVSGTERSPARDWLHPGASATCETAEMLLFLQLFLLFRVPRAGIARELFLLFLNVIYRNS